MTKQTAELAHDLHVGLATLRVSEFDDLQTIGMASTLAIHIKGLPAIDYELLRKVSDHFVSIPSFALEKVARVLAEVGYVRLVENGRKIEQVIPNIPAFDDVYSGIGTYVRDECSLNEHEEATLHILGALQNAPQNRDALFSASGMDKDVFNRCLSVSARSGIVSQHTARGRPILISPYYFSDNLDGLADAAVSAGSNAIKSTLDKVRLNQGWPLSFISAHGEIGGVKLSATEQSLVRKLAAEGMIKPPTISYSGKTRIVCLHAQAR